MKYQITNFKLTPQKIDNLENEIKKHFKLNNFTYKIISKSIDARKKDNILVIYKLIIETNEILKGNNISKLEETKESTIKYPKWSGKSPVIVGFGPSGMFAALYLARCQANPIIIERGSSIEKRKLEVLDFIKNKKLNPNSNVQFGEGGAGTFSDGKLNTNVKNPLINFILNEFYLHGANENILYDAKPHIGTDILEIVVKNIREEIISLGGNFYFNHVFNDIKENNGLDVYVNDYNGNTKIFNTDHLLLGLGHSARDTISHLYNKLNVNMEPKAFSMGVRIEHPKSLIDEAQYGKFAKYLPSAYYNLAQHMLNGRGVYTFCMCPGGYVMASQSEENTICVNGMSNSKRDNFNSNSALLVDVRPSDYQIYDKSALAGMYYQEKYEKLAFNQAGDYRAPANLVKEFLEGAVAKDLRTIKTTYPHGLFFTDLSNCLPDFVIDGLKFGIKEFNKKINGFSHPDAVLVGIEGRSSSPVRIIRDETYQASIKGLYPIGEGAGYAGGITSAALDGLKCAISIVKEKENE